MKMAKIYALVPVGVSCSFYAVSGSKISKKQSARGWRKNPGQAPAGECQQESARNFTPKSDTAHIGTKGQLLKNL